LAFFRLIQGVRGMGGVTLEKSEGALTSSKRILCQLCTVPLTIPSFFDGSFAKFAATVSCITVKMSSHLRLWHFELFHMRLLPKQ